MFEREPVVGTMTAQVARIVGMRIVSGEFVPGDLLPVESELCSEYRVSRTTVREAIKQLTGKRLIEVSPKIGTRVLPFSDWNLLDRDVLAWRLNAQFDSKIVEDIFEMRLCFEPRASFLAARHGSDEDLQLIERRYRELASAYASPSAQSDVRASVEAVLEFHMAIITMSQNGMFITIGSAIKAALRVSSEMLYRQAAKPSEDIALHDDVRSRIVSREPEQASAAMTRLLAASRERMLRYTITPKGFDGESGNE
jgi:DNA-binding FadR family transcriptional regulator